MTVAYRLSAATTPATTDNGWRSHQPHPQDRANGHRPGVTRALQNADGDYLCTRLRSSHTAESAEFEITGLEAIRRRSGLRLILEETRGSDRHA